MTEKSRQHGRRRRRILWISAAVVAVALCVWGALAAAGRFGAKPAADSGGAPETADGYAVSCFWNGAFYAGGAGGRLDRISLDGTRENIPLPVETALTSVCAVDGRLLLGTADGQLLYSGDGSSFTTCNRCVGESIVGIARLNGRYYAMSRDGALRISTDGMQWERTEIPAEYELIALASNGTQMMAVTAEGDILLSGNGTAWTAENFNETYRGLYPTYRFVTASALGDSFFILGYPEEEPGKPLVMYSMEGAVWMQKSISAVNGEVPENFYPLTPRCITSDADQLLAVCSGGRILTIPNCTVCNQLLTLTQYEIHTIAAGPEKILVAGEGFQYQVLDGTVVRQERISAEQAKLDMENGAVLIDVRETEEREQDGYIPGSIHLPLAQVREQLAQVVPDQDTEVIFYCAAGVRAQTALETAQELGYRRVYNLGGLSDWPYDVTGK